MRRTLGAVLACACAVAAGCGGSGGEKTKDTLVYAVPPDARAYVHLDRDSSDWQRASAALERMPAVRDFLVGAVAGIPDLPKRGEAGIAYDPKPSAITPDTRALRRSLGDLPEYRELIAGLPAQRFAFGYASGRGLRALRRLDPSITAVAAAADVIDGDRMRIRVRVHHDDVVGPCSAGRSDSKLLDVADPDAALYLEVPSIACAVRALAGRFRGVGNVVGRIARAARRHGDLSLEKDLLPLLQHRGAVIATRGGPAPALTLVVEDVDEEQALDVLARFQPALVHLLGSAALGQAPTFGAANVEGVTAATARLAPGLELSYAAFDGMLVVSTSLKGIAAVRRAHGLPGTDTFDEVLGSRPSDPSALLFLDLDQLLALGEQAGLAEDPSYLAVRDDLQKLRAAGAVLSREEEFTTAELTFQIP